MRLLLASAAALSLLAFGAQAQTADTAPTTGTDMTSPAPAPAKTKHKSTHAKHHAKHSSSHASSSSSTNTPSDTGASR